VRHVETDHVIILYSKKIMCHLNFTCGRNFCSSWKGSRSFTFNKQSNKIQYRYAFSKL